jgi:hypothetical protein
MKESAGTFEELVDVLGSQHLPTPFLLPSHSPDALMRASLCEISYTWMSEGGSVKAR